MLRWIANRISLLRDREGSAAVEFAIAVPIMLLLLFGVFDFGRMMWLTSSVKHAATEGVRYAMVRGAESTAPATSDQISTYVKSRAAGVNADDLAVAVSWSPDNNPGSLITVQVDYQYEFLLSRMLPFGPVDLSGASTKTVY
jgi:Flp pilus assembly protein TadG